MTPADSAPRVLVVGGSIRASGRDALLAELVAEATSRAGLVDSLRAASQSARMGIANSELLGAAAAFAAREAGASVDYVSLRRLFPVERARRLDCRPAELGLDEEICRVDTTAIRAEQLEQLLERVARADAIVLSSPVYFGDRSSVADTFLKAVHRTQALAGKAYGAISVGAKRNGGQETANIYALFDACNMGALVHGNGPKTSQYGGTAVAGDRGRVLDDAFGLETTFGTGARSAQVGRILAQARQLDAGELPPPRIALVITADTPERAVEARVRAFLARVERDVRAEVLNLIDFRVERCLACGVCPNPPMVEGGSRGLTELGPTDYACIIDNGRDAVECLRERLKGMDGLVVVGVNDDAFSGLVDQYQAFTERTRFIRRADFEWMNTPFTSLILKRIASSRERLFGLRVMTSYLRHNALGVAPIRALFHGEQLLSDPIPGLEAFVDLARRLRGGRRRAGSVEVSYVAGGTGGYADTTLDGTSARRS